MPIQWNYMYSHLRSGAVAKWHHCVENWSSKGVEVGTCSKFKNNLKLSVQFHRENWTVQSNYVLPNSRFENLSDARLLISWPVFYWRAWALLSRQVKQASSFRQPLLAKRTRLYCREWSLRYMKGFVFKCYKLHIFRDHEFSIPSLLLFVFFWIWVLQYDTLSLFCVVNCLRVSNTWNILRVWLYLCSIKLEELRLHFAIKFLGLRSYALRGLPFVVTDNLETFS